VALLSRRQGDLAGVLAGLDQRVRGGSGAEAVDRSDPRHERPVGGERDHRFAGGAQGLRRVAGQPADIDAVDADVATDQPRDR
jgi:hypothetical protein